MWNPEILEKLLHTLRGSSWKTMWYLISLKHRSFLSFLSVVVFLPEDRTVCQSISYHIFVVLLVSCRPCSIIWRENYNLFLPLKVQVLFVFFSTCYGSLNCYKYASSSGIYVSLSVFFSCLCLDKHRGSVCNLLTEFTQNNMNKALKFANNVMVIMIEKKRQDLL